jgi:hypothetical protein
MVDENISNIILERVNRIGERLTSLDEIRSDVAVLKESVRRIDARIAYMVLIWRGFTASCDGKTTRWTS